MTLDNRDESSLDNRKKTKLTKEMDPSKTFDFIKLKENLVDPNKTVDFTKLKEVVSPNKTVDKTILK